MIVPATTGKEARFDWESRPNQNRLMLHQRIETLGRKHS